MSLLSRKPSSAPSQKISREVTILNRLGLHARPSAMFVKVCNRHKCDIWVERDGEQVNGKSIMGLMMLAAGQGSKLRITCEGADSAAALQEIEELIQRRFDEE
jgi:phosphocarrier protein